MKTIHATALTLGALVLLTSGCASVQRGIPTAPAQISVNLERGDYTVLGSVKGTSTLQSYVFGLFRVVDGDKVIVCGFKTFEDQYAFLQDPGMPILQLLTLGLSGGPTAEDRAYYKALSATPDADAIVPKAYVKQTSGIPLIASTREVSFTGKAIKFKTE
jgi:hypothetical protein